MNIRFEIKGKQYNYLENKKGEQVFYIDYQKGTKTGDKIDIEKILSWGDEFGQPYISKAKIILEVIKHGLKKKITIFKYKAKSNYSTKKGHRQAYTKVKMVEKIRE